MNFKFPSLFKTILFIFKRYIAIIKDKVEFVGEFLNHGLVLSKFLTYRRLLKLYNDVSCLSLIKTIDIKRL
jgi:hypothetical protein